MRHLVSICVPAYNCEKTIFHTLQSIISQSYTNIEIIISDNNSTDKTRDVIKKFHDKRIKVYKCSKNIGYARNINKCIGASKGKYVCVFHADDIYDRDIIEKQVEHMEKNDVGAVFTLRRLIDENGKFIRNIDLPFEFKGEYIIGGKKTIFPSMLQYGNFLVCSSAMVRKKVYDEVGLWEEEPKIVEDQNMWLRILEKHRIIIINKQMMSYRKHLGQDSVMYNHRRMDISPEYVLYDEYIEKWKDIVKPEIMDKYNKMKSKAYLFCAVNALLENNTEKFVLNMRVRRII